MWGCFHNQSASIERVSVFPTHVGVFLMHVLAYVLPFSLPHACGGVSILAVLHGECFRSSPRMWGCFPASQSQPGESPVFPTHVGVFLSQRNCRWVKGRLPHACGGVSQYIIQDCGIIGSSPRMWGCFWQRSYAWRWHSVFPTHVGVFPPADIRAFVGISLPHACGGVSLGDDLGAAVILSSPRMWGCFRWSLPSLHQ